MKKSILLALLAITGTLKLSAQNNLDFEQGLEGWQMKGGAGIFSVENAGAFHGKYCVRIGERVGTLQVRISVGPLSIIRYSTHIKTSGKDNKAISFISFYNAKNQLLLTYESAAVDSTEWTETGNYTETPAGTSYAEIGVEKETADAGYIYADDFNIETNIGVPKVNHMPLCDLDQYMHPFWRSDTVYNETVLLFSKNGQPAQGKLLFAPDHVLSVKNFSGKKSYDQINDYTLEGNVITRAPNSHMLFRADTSFDTKKDMAWFNTQSQWVTVSYVHHDIWDGPTAKFKGDLLPQTMAKLRDKKNLLIVAFGMSITRGMDVSSYDTIPPYMPTYVDLFARCRSFGKSYHYERIKLF